MPARDEDLQRRIYRPIPADDSFEAPANDAARRAIWEVADSLPQVFTDVMMAEEVLEQRGIRVTEAAVRGVLVHNL